MTRMKENGVKGEYEVVWGTAMKIFTGVTITLLSGLLIGVLSLYSQVQLLNYRMAQVEDTLRTHLNRPAATVPTASSPDTCISIKNHL